MMSYVFENANVFDGVSAELAEGQHLLVADGLIEEISEQPIHSKSAKRVDLRGATLLPGLIDAHVHANDWSSSPADLMLQPSSLTTLHAARNLKHMLMRGFTTVRDACGSDFGLATAVDLGLITAPRLFFVGKALSPTGGHGDDRGPADDCNPELCGCRERGLCVVVDGETEVRRAARNELRKGAHAVKIMAGGGVSSPTDLISNLQFSLGEMKAIVEEASFRGKYVMAHAYTAESINRCLDVGVRSIEHANLIDRETATRVCASDAFVVPTLIVYAAMSERGAEIGMPKRSIEKIDEITSAGLESLGHLKDAGVKTGFGSDLFGDLQAEQSREFLIRSKVDSNIDVLRSATSVNADLLNMTGKLG
ncbi:MAG: amidohydrolase family protein, partial [Gammaproteobacteria bacterium]|nr:amidohydrolase family protein [Gammaproteobacteria bacterium]